MIGSHDNECPHCEHEMEDSDEIAGILTSIDPCRLLEEDEVALVECPFCGKEMVVDIRWRMTLKTKDQSWQYSPEEDDHD